MPLDFGPIDAQIAEDRRGARPALLTGSRPAGDPPELSLVQQAGDALMGIPRGIEAAAQDVYGLADTLAFDVLPDYEQRVFGTSRTAVGGIVEGFSNFAAGFVGAEFVLPAKLFASAGRFASVARAAAKGALTDFAVFDGHEQRLSNLIQDFPRLQNPITEFLASDPNDPQVIGRLKNALEGVGIGAFIDSVSLGLRAMGIGRKLRAAGATPKEIEEAIDKAIPEADLKQAWKKAASQEPGQGVPDTLGSPTQPEAAQAAAVPPSPEAQAVQTAPTPPAAPTGEEAGTLVLRSMGVDEEKARELYAAVRRRETPLDVGPTSLKGLPPTDPRTNPRKMTPLERMAEGLNVTDLNLSRYRGPDGALQLVRGMAKVFEPLATQGAASYRSLKDIEATALKQVVDITAQEPHAYLVQLQQRASSIAEIRAHLVSDKMALQSAAADAYRLMQAATAPTAGAKDMLAFIESTKFVHDVQLAVSGIAGEFGRGLGANRVPTRYVADMFNLDEIQAALHEHGGQDHVLKIAKQLKVLMDSEVSPAARAAKAASLARGLAGRRSLGVLNEYWMNSLLGRPTTWVVTAMSNALTSVYLPLEKMLGGVLMGQSSEIADGIREVVGLAHSARESWATTVAALKGGGQVLDPRAVVSDIHDVSKKAISSQALGLKEGKLPGLAADWVGKVVRLPSNVMSGVDQLAQQMNYRSVARSELLKEALQLRPGASPAEIAAYVEAKMDKLIHRGQAYGTAQLFHRGVEDAVQRGLTGKAAVDEHARIFVREALASPEHARLSQVSEMALGRAQQASFTTPLTPGTLPYRYQEAVRNHPVLRLITPFVRTPTNVLKFALDRNVNVATGIAQLVANKVFPSLVPTLENSRNAFVRDILSGSPTKRAEAMGRAAIAASTTALVLLKASETDEEGRPLITGFGPADREQRRVLEDAGWRQYSIRIGDAYYSYGRLDPFASMLGVAADIMNHVRYAPAEDQDHVENLSLGLVVSLSHSLTNKTYLSGLANAIDMLSDPESKAPVWFRNLAGSAVPGEAAAAVSVIDPNLRDVRSLLDAMRARWPGASDNLPPLRNVLGEPVRRAQSLGSGLHPITNAFVPILYSEVSDDLVRTGLADLRHGFTPPKRTRGGLDLTQVVRGDRNAYDRWLELHGEVKIGGKTLRQSLRRLMTSAQYTRIPAQSTDQLSSPRIGLVQGVIDDYRAEAYRTLVREFPELAAADRARVQAKVQALRGQQPAPPLLRALQGGQ